MRQDIFQQEVLAKCEALIKSTIWPTQDKIRPRAWLNNFEESDRGVASYLLDKFVFFSNHYTDRLLYKAYNDLISHFEGYAEADLLSVFQNIKVTPLEGELPNPSDSGNLLCRKMRQSFNFAEANIVTPAQAVAFANDGEFILFVDDFIGSGDQFLETWRRNYLTEYPKSFCHIALDNGPTFVVLALVCTESALARINSELDHVTVFSCHIVDERSSIFNLQDCKYTFREIDAFLEKYCDRLTPQEEYIRNNREFLKYGYHRLGLLLGFEHSVPDATLPVFWSAGTGDWSPLYERT